MKIDIIKNNINAFQHNTKNYRNNLSNKNEVGLKPLLANQIPSNSWGIYFQKKARAIYAYDKDGNYEKFNSQSDFAKRINHKGPEITRALKHNYKVAGYGVVFASEIEDEEGNINEIKLQNLAKKLSKKPVSYIYKINPDGQ